MTALCLTVNGARVAVEAEPRTHLADLLRERLNLTGTHLGCEQGACGACTILLDGVPVRACLVFPAMCDGADIRTIEGFDDDPLMARLTDAFTRAHALQCGFCTPGMLITARDIVSRLPGADEARIRRELGGNLCRCTGYVGIVRAVGEVAAAQGAASPPPMPPPAPPRRIPTAFAAHSPATPPRPPAAATAEDGPEPGWTRLHDSFTIARPAADIWALFADLPRMAACMPGAELDSVDGDDLKGRMRVRLGPIGASFAGTAQLRRDDARLRGVLTGAGGDAGSRARGRVAWQLVPQDGATRVDLTLDFLLQGALAQFGRSGLVQDVLARLIRQFADNLASTHTDAAPLARPPGNLGLGAMLWAALRARLARLLHPRTRKE